MLINLTPHTLNVHLQNGEVINIAPSGQIARVQTREVRLSDVEGIPVVQSLLGEPEGLPGIEEGVYYIVSRILLNACPEREDLLAPGALVRNEAGQPVGCRGLSR